MSSPASPCTSPHSASSPLRHRQRHHHHQQEPKDDGLSPRYTDRTSSGIDRALGVLALSGLIAWLAIDVGTSLSAFSVTMGGGREVHSFEAKKVMAGGSTVAAENKTLEEEGGQGSAAAGRASAAVAIAAEMAAEMAEGGTKFSPPPRSCTTEQLYRIQDSGLSSEGCSSVFEPLLQTCSFTKQTGRSHGQDVTWLDGFAGEVREMRALSNGDHGGGDDDGLTFLGVIVGKGCDKTLEDALYWPKSADAETVDSVLRKPKLLCTDPPNNAESDFVSRWGLASFNAIGGFASDLHCADPMKCLDGYMESNWHGSDIKDVVLINNEGLGYNTIMTGLATLARTRYVEFGYHYNHPWGTQSLREAVARLDGIGFTCYWPGRDRLWRITACWQYYYGYHSWSHVACANRHLAPRLSDRMEEMFLTTIDISKDAGGKIR